jgi:hypothetical protein
MTNVVQNAELLREAANPQVDLLYVYTPAALTMSAACRQRTCVHTAFLCTGRLAVHGTKLVPEPAMATRLLAVVL